MINRISKVEIVSGVRDYRMMTRQMVNAVLSMKEYSRFSKGIFAWVGFKTKYLEYHNVERVAGETDWTTHKLFKYALGGIADFSQAPLNLAVWIGTTSFILSIIGLLVVIVRKLIVPGSSILVGPAQFHYFIDWWLAAFVYRNIGRIIGKIYLQVKERPIYIVKEEK